MISHARWLSVALLPLLAACAGSAPVPNEKPDVSKPAEASIEAKQVAAQEGTSHVVELRFTKGQAELSKTETAKLEDAIKEAAKKGEIRKAVLIAWSDHEMPTEAQKSLGEADVDLAKRRGETLEKYFQDHHAGVKTDVVNMGKRPGKLDNFLKTEDARVQDGLATSDVPTQAKKDGTALRKASHAIVVLKLKIVR